MNIHVKFLCRSKFSFLLGIYLEVEFLGHMVAMFNSLRKWETIS